ncbi:mitochondrial tRNA-specific 2-thiouridylase 1 [Lepeophtheirus salmonis]|uniref:mitochondrial tRNA-specific 2-thiouridylase 1 n=1 Tax=Lepeophtheirus salmonis TaxID=72036 RepID=UPI001AE4D4B7|nr:mitochondrial tRNA-specific 2-thiouridylase 1-like [Lepeophtheirus salmonis]XP_040568843.1 mitochondrial tRNA-specific 2-thiouridylase 1-like [Lepeophtheirus salmonis]
MIRRVAVGISGGVDSAVSALLLKKRGFEVIGVYMKNWEPSDEDNSICDGTRDSQTAQSVCERLNIPFKSVNFVKEYWNDVFLNMLEDYQSGLTPNPDILCNSKVKFDKFQKYCLDNLGVDAVATGHYARNSYGENLELAHRGKRAKLLKPIDRHKDQTIFLSQMSQHSLKKAMFPVGSITKEVVKKIASASGFEDLAKKKESMGICFIGKRKDGFQNFIRQYVSDRPGEIIDIESKKVIGTHNGIHQWTLGQRVRIGGLKDKVYICGKNVFKNELISCYGSDHPSLFSDSFTTKEAHWIDRPPRNLCSDHLTLEYRFQNTHPLTPASVRVSHKEKKCKLSVISALRQRAITPGQFAAFYLGDECLGSAVIDKVGPSLYDMKCHKGSCIKQFELNKNY